MSKIILSTKEIKDFKTIQIYNERAITYTESFKNRFIDEYLAGKLPRQIFIENGFGMNVIGMKRIEQSAYRWKKLMKRMV